MPPRIAIPELDYADLEELRLALVMNGGVSLAVWMGGVSSEFNRLVRKEGVYADLLRATGTEARVDVVSGTSAGGINGALLALASVYDSDLAPLRDVWLDEGDVEQMLRSPLEADPPSLLRGDDYFLVALRRAFRAVRDSGTGLSDSDRVPIELTLTTTLLHGIPNKIPDDFGTVIADVDHRARFVFKRGPGLSGDPFDDEHIADRLAFAARATASFPVAFEPVFYPENAPDEAKAPRAREARNLDTSRFLLDGGILDNKPLESAVDAIFAQRADRDVRRVLGYVVPNPGVSAQVVPDERADLPGIKDVALASLMELPRVESISAQIRAVVNQNRQVRRKHQNRAGVMTLDAVVLKSLARQLFPVYRQRRLESSAAYLLPEVSDGLIARTNGQFALGRRLQRWLTAQFLEAADQVPWTPTVEPMDALAEHERDDWRWGVFALENMADMMLDVLRRTMRLTYPGVENRPVREGLMALRSRAYDVLHMVREGRANDSEFWRSQSLALVGYFTDHGTGGLRSEHVTAWIREALQSWRGHFVGKDLPLAVIALEIGTIIRETAALFRQDFPECGEWQRVEDRAAHEAVRRYFDALAPAGANTANVLENLLVVEVILNAFGSYRDVRDQYVEMVQISADVPTSFGGPASAADKLAGAQLANFGGFLKRSWRANDWMYGRLDGAERLSRIVLNPERLRRLYGSYTGRRRSGVAMARDVIHWVAVGGVGDRTDRVFLERLWRSQERRLDRELAFLDDSAIPVPEQLPACAAAVARRLHLEILRAELPVVAAAAEHDIERRGGNPRGPGADFELAWDQAMRAAQGKTIAPETIVAAFKKCRIGGERVSDEIGSDLATSVASTAVAVAVSAGAGERSNLGPVRRIFQAGRVPAIAFEFLAQGLIKQSRTMVSVFTAAFTVGAVLLVLGLTYAEKMPGVLVSTGAMLFAASIAVAFLRFRVLATAFVVIGGVLMVVAISPEPLSHVPIGDEARILGRVIAVFAFLALTCVLAYFVSRGRRVSRARPTVKRERKSIRRSGSARR